METRGNEQKLHDQEWVCTVFLCLYKNRYQHVHLIFMWFLLVERCCNIKQRCRCGSAIETRGTTQRLHDHEWICTTQWCLYPNRFPHWSHISTWFFWMSAVAGKTAVIVLAEHRNYVVSHEYTMTNIGYALLSGVCMKIDIRISIVCPCNSWRLSAFVIQNSIAVLAAQLKHLVLNKDSVMNDVCITTDFHISVICLRGLFVKRCCNTERHHRPRSAPETRGIPRVHHDENWVCIT